MLAHRDTIGGGAVRGPSDQQYHDFQIRLGYDGSRLHAETLDEPHASGEALFSIVEQDVDYVLGSITQSARGRLKRSAGSDVMWEFGRLLHETLFLETGLYEYYQAALADHRQLPIRLIHSDQWVGSLPWELLYSKREDHFLALSSRSAVLRQVASAYGIEYIAHRDPATGALRVVLAGEEADVGLMGGSDRYEVDHVLNSTPGAIAAAASALSVDILHVDPYSPRALDAIVDAAVDARLLVLAGADSAHAAATAASLGVPAAIGVQGEMTPEAFQAFSRTVYAAIAEEMPLPDAVTAARRTVDLEKPGSGEWALPVLYVQTENPGPLLAEPPDTDGLESASTGVDDRRAKLLLSQIAIEEANRESLQKAKRKGLRVEKQLEEVAQTIEGLRAELQQF